MTQISEDKVLARQQHIQYFKYHLQILPARYSSLDTSRVSIAFFALSGLDLLGAIDEIEEDRKRSICDWLYQLQVLPDASGDSSKKKTGFQGSTTLNFCNNCDDVDRDCSPEFLKYMCGHLAMTYTALACLVILGDDLSRVDRRAIVQGIMALQQPDGSFSAIDGNESDMRFVYCAACICYMLDDWSGINKEKTVDFILASMSYDFGFGQGPGLESHGGSTYCALAALFLMNRVKDTFTADQMNGLKKWTLMRQVSGFQGRPNKPVDTCYSFWVGASLKLLGIFDLSDATENKGYILNTQDSIVGGFAKWVDSSPDPMHSYMGISGLSILGDRNLLEVDPRLNISKRAIKHLEEVQRSWKERR